MRQALLIYFIFGGYLMKKTLLITLAALMMQQSAFALTVYDPSNHEENLAAKLEAIKQTAHQAEILQSELKNLAKLSPAYQDETLAEIRSCVKSMMEIRKSVNAIGTDFNSMMEGFEEISPDYEDWNGVSAEQYARQMDKVRKAWDNALKQSLLSQTEASPDKQANTAELVNKLVEASQNAEGTTGVLQALAQLNAVQISELQKMQAIAADAQRTQNMYQKRLLEAEKAGRKLMQESNEAYEAKLKRDVKIESTGEGIHHFSK